MSQRLLVATVALALLVLPAGALAQSAGDDQYTDPFAPAEEPQGGGGSDPEPTEAPTPAPAPAPPEEPAVEGAQESQAPAVEPAPTLPRSGFPAGAAAGTGALLVAAGAALRRRA
jgi:hypothetical protein